MSVSTEGISPDGISIDSLIERDDAPLVATTLGQVRLLVFNRPAARNAMSRDMRVDYARLVAEAEADPTIKVIIVTGAHGYFTSGVDLKENPPGVIVPMFRPHPVEATRPLTKPTIAMVDGPCVTGGLELALACSFIIASDRSRFVDTHLKIGKFPGWGLTSLLPAAIGARRARQMSLSGEFIDARTALEWGLVNELTSVEALLPRCLEVAHLIGRCDPRATRNFLQLSTRIEGESLEAALAVEVVAVERHRAGL